MNNVVTDSFLTGPSFYSLTFMLGQSVIASHLHVRPIFTFASHAHLGEAYMHPILVQTFIELRELD